MIRLYLDNCCLNRPFDDPEQDRIRLEGETILTIVKKVRRSELVWVTSAILDMERSSCPSARRRELVTRLFDLPHEIVELTWKDTERATKLSKFGLKGFDAFHVAAAERGKCTAFLTTDDRLISKARVFQKQLHVSVLNPVDWVLGNL